MDLKIWFVLITIVFSFLSSNSDSVGKAGLRFDKKRTPFASRREFLYLSFGVKAIVEREFWLGDVDGYWRLWLRKLRLWLVGDLITLEIHLETQDHNQKLTYFVCPPHDHTDFFFVSDTTILNHVFPVVLGDLIFLLIKLWFNKNKLFFFNFSDYKKKYFYTPCRI